MPESLPAGQMPLTVGEPAGAARTEQRRPIVITRNGAVIDEAAIDRAVEKAQAKAVQRAVDRAKRRNQLRGDGGSSAFGLARICK